MTASSSEFANDAMIREFFKAVERRDVDHIASCLAEDAVYDNIPLDPIVGRVAIHEFLSRRADLPPPRVEIHHQLVAGDVVMNERTDYTSHDGREIPLRMCGVFEIHDGLITAWREYFDSGRLR